MRKLLILFFLITLSCSTSNTENNVVLNESVELSTPTPEVDEVLEVKKNDGEIKYNHPKIKNDKEQVELSFVNELLEKQEKEDKSFNIFIDLANLSEINLTLDQYDGFTILVPDDNVFESLDQKTKEEIFSSKETAYEVISNHILPFKFKESNLKKYSHLDTINGGSIDVEVSDRKLIINESIRIIEKDIKVENGIIHLIDNAIMTNDLEVIDTNNNLINFKDILERKLVATKMIFNEIYEFDSQYTLELKFDNQGRYSGKYLCNNIFGNYKINDNGNIIMESPASTKMFCFPPNETVETDTDIMIDLISDNELILGSDDQTSNQIFLQKDQQKLIFSLNN